MDSEVNQKTCKDSRTGDLYEKLRPCFILAIMERCGTNYIYKLLGKHPDCIGPGTISEDYVLYHSQTLKDYAESLVSSWNPAWGVEEKLGLHPQKAILSCFGDALFQFLKLQISREPMNRYKEEHEFTQERRPKVFLSKTPKVGGLENFFDLFPEANLLIIIRDGRAVIESGVRSFGWDYENATRAWKAGAEAVRALEENKCHSGKKLHIVKYEDLLVDEEKELRKIFAFLDIDPDLFDFKAAKSMGIFGSSETKMQTGTLHWDEVKKGDDFNPLNRFDNWNKKRHERFNWIAGITMSHFGYDLEPITLNSWLYKGKNRFLDTKQKIQRVMQRAFSHVVTDLKKAIKLLSILAPSSK